MNLEALSFECRQNVLDMIMEGRAGHIGGDFSVMDILITLYFKQMNISPDNLDDPDRDLFVMSKGHSVEAYYAVLAAKGFLDIEDVIKNFSKFGSPYIGHPNNKLPGIEMNSVLLDMDFQFVLVWHLQIRWMERQAVFTQLWVTASWQKVLYGKVL